MTDNQKQTKPSAPEYRSAQIGSLIAPAIPPSRTMQEIFQQQSKMNSRTTEILSSSEPSKAWIIDRLPPTVPKGHLLERTTFDVHDMTPQEVADRLSNCLRFHSIHCQASEENKNSIRAESNQGLMFSVTLYMDAVNVTVECQRLAGCSYEFHKTYQSICFSTMMLEKEPIQRRLDFPSCIPGDSGENVLARASEAFQIAIDLVHCERLDSQLLGLQSMEQISANHTILAKLLSDECLSKLIEFCTKNQEYLSVLDKRHDCLSKRRALSILANGVSECNTLKHAIPRMLIAASFIEQLLMFLCNSSRDPHQAFQAARCLVGLASGDRDAKAMLVKANVRSMLPAAECPHLALEQEYKKLAAILSP